MASSVGGTLMASSRLYVGLGVLCGALLAYLGVRLYDKRWRRLQAELFVKRSRTSAPHDLGTWEQR